MKKNFPLPALFNTIAHACRAIALFGLLTITLPSVVYAHRGANDEVDAHGKSISLLVDKKTPCWSQVRGAFLGFGRCRRDKSLPQYMEALKGY